MHDCLHGLDEEQLESLRGCSQFPQFYHGLEGFKNGKCPFCEIDNKLNKVLYNHNGWIAWEVPQNFTTRQSTLDLQLLFFPKRHVRRLSELDRGERLGFFSVIDWAEKKYNMPGGGLISRFGDMRYNVGTIMHLHATIMVPNRTGAVIFPLQKDSKMWAKHDARMQEFALRYEAGEVPE